MVEQSRIEKLDSVTFDELIKQQNPFEQELSTLDLSDVRMITPAVLVQLAAICYALAKEGREVTIILGDASVGTYLARAGFVTAVEPVARIEPQFFTGTSYERLRGTNPTLIEVTKIETGSALPDILDHIVSVLRERFRYRKYDAFDAVTAISEICQNTFDHNREICGFVAMQVYGKGSKRFLEIGVADCGDGLAKTLSRNPKNPKIATDLEAIRMATELGTSEHDDPTRGTGLYHLLEIAYKHEGAVQIRSGSGKVRYRMDKQRGWAFSVPYVPGVQIALTLGTKKARKKT
jgi:hypothetical protein